MSQLLSFSPHIVVSDAAAAIDFYKAAFGAEELVRHLVPNSGKVMHACLKIAGGNLMLNDDFSAAMGGKPETAEALGGSPVTFHIQTDDADGAWATALAAGAAVKMPWPTSSGATATVSCAIPLASTGPSAKPSPS